jgi:hypothetical protein
MIFGKQVLILLEFIDDPREFCLSVGRSWSEARSGEAEQGLVFKVLCAK